MLVDRYGFKVLSECIKSYAYGGTPDLTPAEQVGLDATLDSRQDATCTIVYISIDGILLLRPKLCCQVHAGARSKGILSRDFSLRIKLPIRLKVEA